MFEFFNDIGNYEQRRVGRKTVNGLIVSTAYSSDEGYETALLDENGAHPVERYKTKLEAKRGHRKWTIKAKTIRVVNKLGGMDGFVPDELIKIRRTPCSKS